MIKLLTDKNRQKPTFLEVLTDKNRQKPTFLEVLIDQFIGDYKMSLYREYLKKYEKSYLKKSEETRNNLSRGGGGFLFMKEYAWIAMEYLKDMGVIDEKDVEEGALQVKANMISLRAVIFKLEQSGEYLMLDSVLRFMDDMERNNGGDNFFEEVFYNIGVAEQAGMVVSAYYRALLKIKLSSAN